MKLHENKIRLIIALLITIIIVMIVQNYIIVKKNSELTKRIAILSQEINRLSVLSTGDSIHPFLAQTIDGSFVTFDPAIEKNTILAIVFTSTCESCIKAASQWNLLVNEIPIDVGVIGISPDSTQRIMEFSARAQLDFQILSLARNLHAAKQYKFFTFPQTLLIRPGGVVQKVWVGVLNEKDRQDILDSLNSKEFES